MDARYFIIHKGWINEVPAVPNKLLMKSISQALCKTTLNLTFDSRGIDCLSHIMSQPGPSDIDLACRLIYLDLHHVRTKKINTQIGEREATHHRPFWIERLPIIHESALAYNRTTGPIEREHRNVKETNTHVGTYNLNFSTRDQLEVRSTSFEHDLCGP